MSIIDSRPNAVWMDASKKKRDSIVVYLAQVTVELPRETEGAGRPANGSRNEMIQITVCRRSQFQGAEADIIEGLCG